MKKQFTITLALLALSLTFTGCGQKTPSEPVATEMPAENETSGTDATQDIPAEDSSTETPAPEASDAVDIENAAPSATDETASSNNESNSNAAQNNTNKPETSAKPESTSKPVASAKPESTSKPAASAKPQAPSKPETSAKPQAPSKPETSAKPESTKPEAPSKPQASLSSTEVFNQITKGLSLPNQMALDDSMLKDFYNLDTSLLENYHVQMAMMSSQITEIGVFKVKDANNVSAVVDAINQRANDKGISLYPSLEETYESRQVITKGNYILFVVSDDVNTIVSRFNSLV